MDAVKRAQEWLNGRHEQWLERQSERHLCGLQRPTSKAVSMKILITNNPFSLKMDFIEF